jgi:hypothetical protein
MTSTPERMFEDVRGLFAAFRWLMPHPIYLALRALAAVCPLWVAPGFNQPTMQLNAGRVGR